MGSSEAMVMEAIAAAYKAGLKKGREQQKQLQEQVTKPSSAMQSPKK